MVAAEEVSSMIATFADARESGVEGKGAAVVWSVPMALSSRVLIIYPDESGEIIRLAKHAFLVCVCVCVCSNGKTMQDKFSGGRECTSRELSQFGSRDSALGH